MQLNQRFCGLNTVEELGCPVHQGYPSKGSSLPVPSFFGELLNFGEGIFLYFSGVQAVFLKEFNLVTTPKVLMEM